MPAVLWLWIARWTSVRLAKIILSYFTAKAGQAEFKFPEMGPSLSWSG